MIPSVIERWHAIVAARDAHGLDQLLADDVIFQSPVVQGSFLPGPLSPQPCTVVFPDDMAWSFRRLTTRRSW